MEEAKIHKDIMPRITLYILLLATSCWSYAQKYTSYVDTRVGTAASTIPSSSQFGKKGEIYGNTLPAVLAPNGMNFWTPQTRGTELKGHCPYYYADHKIQGFRNSHWIVGGATQDYGSMTIMPVSGKLVCTDEARASSFIHSEETATPSYYSVKLNDYGIKAEMTGLSHSGIFRLNYPTDKAAWLIITPNSDEGEGYIEIDVRKRQIRGYNPVHRIYQGKGKNAGFCGYFVVEFLNAIDTFGVFHGERVFNRRTVISGSKEIGAYIQFRRSVKMPIMVRVGTSFTSMEAAEKNLRKEIDHWDFDYTRWELTQMWEKRLGQIEIDGTPKQKQMFYGALYRSSFLPHEVSDVDGAYCAFSKGKPIMYTENGRKYYDDFSMWDTYRALHPLQNILQPEMSADMMESLVIKSEQGGWMPIFPCWNSYTAAMIGDHCTAAIADAYIKGINNFDIEKAYAAMRRNAFEKSPDSEYTDGKGRRAIESYMKYGFIPMEDSVKDAYHKCEQSSRTMEYAFDDYALAQIALKLGKTDDYNTLMLRSRNYRNVIDSKTGYITGRHTDGRFEKSNPLEFASFITEGTPCHYTWYVPHDIDGLIGLMGGKKNFTARLDSMFNYQRYWHGNEPCHQIAYLFPYGGQPWKTQMNVRNIVKNEYNNAPGGLAGNDDAGQMSAWYIFSTLGFYPVCPSTPYYIIGSPLHEKATIKLANGKTFTIKTFNNNEENVYIQYMTLNGHEYKEPYLKHSDIMNGGTFEILMGKNPNKKAIKTNFKINE